ncbi:radical SAM/SPASM domain-containing protein [Methanosarcina sp.]|uniref:radical SAM/SPASM domain-containing protein n=1 Tax=Methanosarcina sp. TaxID=2213 RepID=UPI002ABA2CE9|nr:radical SAM protein [Methanosarcina sp.]MDY9925068.1 radical SAM protein [Methanosarcina sp.]
MGVLSATTMRNEEIENKKYNDILQQIFTIPLDEEKYLVYAPLKGIAFIGNTSLVNSIFEHCSRLGTCTPTSNNPSDVPSVGVKDELNFLQKLDFFQPAPLPVDEYEQKGVQYDAVILFLTNQCNLRCSYCYASSGEHQTQQMPWDLAKASIDFVMREVVRNHSPIMTLGFHGGGEPTLNWDVLTRATDYAHSLEKKNNIQLQVTGAFNGYWPEKVLHYIIKNFTELSLSFDGMPSVQNSQRPAINKKDSFPRVAKTLHTLDQVQFPYGIRMTVTNDSVCDLAENISFICENFKPKKIQVEPAFNVGRAKKNKSTITDLDIFVDQFIRGFKEAEKHQITLFYSGARLDALTQRFCLAACRALVVTPDGDITTCFETYSREHPLSQHFIVGSYRGNRQFFIEEEKLRHHFSRTIESIPHCEGCFCKWHCAGDCAIKTFSEETIDGFHSTERCFVNQELIKFFLLNKIKENGGLIWANKYLISSLPKEKIR